MPPPPARRPRHDLPDGSRARVLAAARREFATRGFAGSSVDRIAAAARLNKAMIYYHFRSKAALYQEILRDMFGAVAARVRGITAAGRPPQEQVSAFVRAIATEAEARPHFPSIWFREIADGGAHLDDATLHEIAAVVQGLAGYIERGVRARVFRPVEPVLVHAGIVGPLLLYFASANLRHKMERAGVAGAVAYGRDEVIAHVERVALAVLEGRIDRTIATAGSPAPRLRRIERAGGRGR